MKILAPLEPEPQRDWDHLRNAQKLGLFPGNYFLAYAMKCVEWEKRQKWYNRIWRGIFGERG